jgi:hypothetical protein
LSNKSENLIPDQPSPVEAVDAAPNKDAHTRRKEFVEPEVSFPVDVLEATTFFQLTDSGSTT